MKEKTASEKIKEEIIADLIKPCEVGGDDLAKPYIPIKNIYELLSAPFPKEAIQRASKEQTKKGYDTTGIGYQHIVNRFNEVLGVQGWWFDYVIVKEMQGTFSSGKSYHDLTVEVTITIEHPISERSDTRIFRKCVGGHISSAYADAYKGAITNALKKTAALFGVGKGAYEGTLDDDASYEEEIGGKRTDIERCEIEQSEIEAIMVNPIDPQKEMKKLLTYQELLDKMSTSENVFELNNRCKKYKEDFSALTIGERTGILKERGRRKLYLETGSIGEYGDFKIISVEKKA